MFSVNKVKDIYDAIYPYYVVSKLLGFAAFPLRAANSKKLFFAHFFLNFIYLGVLVYFHASATLYYAEHRESYKAYKDSTITNITRHLLTTSIFLNFFVALVMNLILQRPIQNLFLKISESDREMRKIGIEIDYRSHYTFIMLFLVATLVHSVAVVAITYVIMMPYPIEGRSSESVEGIFSYITSTVSFTIFSGQMLLALVAIYSRFRLLNKQFREIFIKRSITEIHHDDSVELIRNFASNHDHLIDIICQTNLCFSFQIMMNMISWFIYTIYGTFNFYRLILINFKGYELLGYANMMWIVYHAMYLSAVVIFSSLIKAEGKKTSILLHQAINLEWNSKIVREMRIFSQQLGHRQPIVTCGLFPFDWSLFYSSIGLCVTYLTIMIQLDSSYSNPQLNVTLPAT
uniref:Gustatory receptor n=1 Tax=Lutzomyia longipalpis TaxID=7200 RepID=A0A3F2ZDJ3_LUTLO